jgi:hypothetical protein
MSITPQKELKVRKRGLPMKLCWLGTHNSAISTLDHKVWPCLQHAFAIEECAEGDTIAALHDSRTAMQGKSNIMISLSP